MEEETIPRFSHGCPESSNWPGLIVGLGKDSIGSYSAGYSIILHLIFYSGLTVISLIAYSARLYWGWEKKDEEAPSFLNVLLTREDEWLTKKKGRAALDYLKYQRMLFVVCFLIQLISIFAATTNMMAGSNQDHNLAPNTTNITRMIDSSSITNLSVESNWHFYHILCAFLLPYIVILATRLCLRIPLPSSP